jgi:translation elongation factor EF-1beta
LRDDRVNFTGSAVAAPAAAAPAAGKGKAKAAAPAKKADDDDMDLFGDEEEEPQEEQPKLSLKERAAALKAKKKEDAKVERSQIVFEVKPVDTEVDLNALFKTITARQFDGLTWGEGYELKPVAYGIQKLVMSCVIIDDKVLIDDIFEPIEAMEDEVQSVDMLTMNKI